MIRFWDFVAHRCPAAAELDRSAAEQRGGCGVARGHLFAGAVRFADIEALLAFLHAPVAGPDASGVWPSEFGREAGLSAAEYDSGGIAFALADVAEPVRNLLADHRYSEAWPCGGAVANLAVLVYPPNRLRHPDCCSLPYLGEVEVEWPATGSTAAPDPAGE